MERDNRTIVKNILKEIIRNLILIAFALLCSGIFYVCYNYKYNPKHNTYENLGDCPYDEYISSEFEIKELSKFRQGYFEDVIIDNTILSAVILSVGFVLLRYFIIFARWLNGEQTDLLLKMNFKQLLKIKMDKSEIKYIIQIILFFISGLLFYQIGIKLTDAFSKLFALAIFLIILFLINQIFKRKSN